MLSADWLWVPQIQPPVCQMTWLIHPYVLRRLKCWMIYAKENVEVYSISCTRLLSDTKYQVYLHKTWRMTWRGTEWQTHQILGNAHHKKTHTGQFTTHTCLSPLKPSRLYSGPQIPAAHHMGRMNPTLIINKPYTFSLMLGGDDRHTSLGDTEPRAAFWHPRRPASGSPLGWQYKPIILR